VISAGSPFWLFAVALGASALGGTLGMASGIFIVPLLTAFGHADIRTAIGASLVSVIACSCGGASSSLRGQLTNVRLAIVLETATTLGALTGVLLAGAIATSYLFGLFAIVLLISAQQMYSRRGDRRGPSRLARKPQRWEAALRLDSRDPERARQGVTYQVERLPLGLLLMYGAGVISALLGIGSGVLKIPAMDTALRLPMKVSSATSNFMIGVTAAASAGAYFLRGHIVTTVAGPVALGSVVGAVIGARALMTVSNDRVRLLFVVVLAGLAIQMFLAAFGLTVLGGAA
jgi:uncharacterized membrane protein YfcA